jgi:hypothetical protein
MTFLDVTEQILLGVNRFNDWFLTAGVWRMTEAEWNQRV